MQLALMSCSSPMLAYTQKLTVMVDGAVTVPVLMLGDSGK
jgi:hypothetical protein